MRQDGIEKSLRSAVLEIAQDGSGERRGIATTVDALGEELGLALRTDPRRGLGTSIRYPVRAAPCSLAAAGAVLFSGRRENAANIARTLSPSFAAGNTVCSGSRGGGKGSRRLAKRWTCWAFLVLLVRIELTTSPLPRGCSTTELQQRSRPARARHIAPAFVRVQGVGVDRCPDTAILVP